ncbi:MAG: ABC transporter permease [Dehalococcoidia bacterium]|nr:ABC transporter permease [Dehalococcoidia bacterium]MDZ4247110.1 ABC transporter permease [Dehalococcoidia bacterium]
MSGLATILRKELTDQFRSKRYIILFLLILLSSGLASYGAAQSIRDELSRATASTFVFLRLFTTSGGVLPSFLSFMGFLGPIVGIALGFDAINSEQSSGTISRVLSQPIYRDSLINGKFLAAITIIGVMFLSIFLIVGGLGLRLLGVPPSSEEIVRILVFLVLCVVYVGFWMGLAILFSIFFKRPATSALGVLAIWLFLSVFMFIVANLVTTYVVSDKLGQQLTQEEFAARQQSVRDNVMRISPSTLFEEASVTVLTPTVRSLGPLLSTQTTRLVPNPLSLGQSMGLVWPHLTGLIALTALCFGGSYVSFMRREIRST